MTRWQRKQLSHRPFEWRDALANVLAVAAAIFVGLFLIGAIAP